MGRDTYNVGGHMVSESELFDQFIQWLEKPYGDYSRNEQIKLWEEFHEMYPRGIEPWGEEQDED